MRVSPVRSAVNTSTSVTAKIDRLHNVNFSSTGPIYIVSARKHPKAGQELLACRKLNTCLKFAIGEITLPIRLDAPRCICSTLIQNSTSEASRQNKVSTAKRYVLRTTSVALLLIIFAAITHTPPITISCAPFISIESTLGKLIKPN